MYKKATLLTINYQREKVTAVAKREGDGSHKERKRRQSQKLSTYCFLTETEAQIFASKEQQYLIKDVFFYLDMSFRMFQERSACGSNLLMESPTQISPQSPPRQNRFLFTHHNKYDHQQQKLLAKFQNLSLLGKLSSTTYICNIGRGVAEGMYLPT